MYDHSRQYRCTIIRGKSQSKMDNLLPLYARIIDNICPSPLDRFESDFDNALGDALPGSQTAKTLSNHRTEIAHQLFGMYYISENSIVYTSDRTKKFLADNDTPAFFKDICYKMQFPNGSQAIQTVKERITDSICIRQFPFLLKVMLLAKSNGINMTKNEIGYYILSSLDVLQGNANPLEVYDAIAADRNSGIVREFGSGSHEKQHTNEQINLLELANLVIVRDGEVFINPREIDAIQLFASKYADKPEFDVYTYDLDSVDSRRKFYLDWDFYFAQLSEYAKSFDTSLEALGVSVEPEQDESGDDTSGERPDTTIIGDEGERYVFEYEKRRVKEFNFRLVGKVLHLGKTRGLGYDIQSVVAKSGDNSDYVKYIEVKATKRVTYPNVEDTTWIDTVNITRNEWVAAQQHTDYYSIFRVYFVRDAVIMFIINNVAKKVDDNIISATPMMYRIDFSNNAVDEVIPSTGGYVTNA